MSDKNKQPTFYIHDYETFGQRPALDRPAQFAGVRTDLDFNIIEEPLVVYCAPRRRLPAAAGSRDDNRHHPATCLSQWGE